MRGQKYARLVDAGVNNKQTGGCWVAVIIPAHNHARCLPKSVSSALQQTAPPAEVIVVDDGSTDDTERVAREFPDRVRYIRQENRGPSSARNRGARAASAELVAFLDADDYWAPEFLACCVEFLDHHSECVAVSTGLRFHHLDGRISEAPPTLPAKPRQEPFVIEDFFAFWAEHDHIRTGSCVLRRNALEAAGWQREDLRIAEDLELWAILATRGKWGFIPKPMWVCDSERAGATLGWRKKYRARRANCPTVEQWQERVVPRLRENDWPGFKRVRGRVAANFAQNHILAGRASLARQIVHDYGIEMPATWSSRLLRNGDRAGALGWTLGCGVVRAREYQKVMLLSTMVRLRGDQFAGQ